MGIVAGVLIQNALKYLLGFGDCTHYLGYNALLDYFPKSVLRPNPECENHWCRKRQLEYQINKKEIKEVKPVIDKKVVHSEDGWGITLVDSSMDVVTEDNSVQLKHEYTQEKSKLNPDDVVKTDENLDLADLMGQLRSLSKN